MRVKSLMPGPLRRVCEVKLFGQNKFEIKQQKYRISAGVS
jgi:hexokinase